MQNQTTISHSHIVKELFQSSLIDQDVKQYAEYCDDAIQVHFPNSWKKLLPMEITDLQSAQQVDEVLLQAFKIQQYTITEIFTDAQDLDKTAVLWDAEGVHVGDFFNLKATNQKFSISGSSVYRFNESNKIIEIWQAWDMLGLLEQIGYVRPMHAMLDAVELEELNSKFSLLSARERECLYHLLQGNTAKVTAQQLALSYRTIESYYDNIKIKLNCLGKRELFELARLFDAYGFFS